MKWKLSGMELKDGHTSDDEERSGVVSVHRPAE